MGDPEPVSKIASFKKSLSMKVDAPPETEPDKPEPCPTPTPQELEAMMEKDLEASKK